MYPHVRFKYMATINTNTVMENRTSTEEFLPALEIKEISFDLERHHIAELEEK